MHVPHKKTLKVDLFHDPFSCENQLRVRRELNEGDRPFTWFSDRIDVTVLQSLNSRAVTSLVT